MPRATFNELREKFSHKMDIDSEYKMLKRFEGLTTITPMKIDCCINSCIAYTARYSHSDLCDFCGESRFDTQGKPRRQFSYMPLVPQLQGLFAHEDTVKTLLYCHRYNSSPNTVNDVFDGKMYQSLRDKFVVVDGIQKTYKYFSGDNDIAFSLATDGYLLFGRYRKGPSATPILVQIYNFPPTMRTHHEHLICLGVIPGPKSPKDIASFLVPFENECAKLANGTLTFDSLGKQMFWLHAYNIFKLGDILAIEKLLEIRGHNGFAPCRSCLITGVRNKSANKTNYYVPLTPPTRPNTLNPRWDPLQLPLRSHAHFEEVLQEIDKADTAMEKERIGKQNGLRAGHLDLSDRWRVASIDFSKSFPWEWMHIFPENIVPMLVNHWTRKFKGMDAGKEDYEIADHIWTEIGEETAAAIANIPATFVRVLSNIADDRSNFTAESWSFWIIHLAPTLLRNRFPKAKYHKHLCELVWIMKKTLQFSITHAEIDELEQRIANWVVKYEK
jgi:hypothetical protein